MTVGVTGITSHPTTPSPGGRPCSASPAQTTCPPPSYQSIRLNCERLEARETPATFFVALRSVVTGEVGTTAATISGSLDLNAAYPSVPGGILVDAPSATDAIRQGLFGRIGVRFNGEAYYYDYNPTMASGTWADPVPFYIQAYTQPATVTHVVRFEDRASRPGCDWDHNDRWWFVDAIDVDNPPPPPPGTVGNTPPPVGGPKLEILNANNTGMTDAKVAKWGSAYEQVGAKVPVKADHPTGDADRFYLRVTDPYYGMNPNPGPQTLQVRTDSDMMTGGLTLTQVAAGVYESRKCILVSNTVDDDFKVNGVNDNAVDDATYRVKLGDTLTITYDSNPVPGGARPLIHKRVPVRVLKEAKVNVTVMMVMPQPPAQGPPGPVASQAQVDQWLTAANETYAQVGVRLTWTVQFAEEPKKTRNDDMDVNLSNGLLVPPISDIEARSMIRGYRVLVGSTAIPIRTAATDDVELFIINYFADGGGNSLTGFRGLSFPPAAMSLHPDSPDIVDSVIVSARYRTTFTVAHEIGHILTNAGHYGDPPGTFTPLLVQPNLMRRITSDQDRLDPYQETINDVTFWTTASKRLNDDQQTRIHTERTQIVKDFIP